MTDRSSQSLYIHLPYCVRKCPYCDFNSHAATARTSKSDYVEALVTDIRREASAEHRSGVLHSVFLGGGTPSFFTPDEIAEVLDAVRTSFRMTPDAEITMEANPGTVESGAPAGYRAAGVNRLSIGAQSFNSDMLTALGRIHSVDDIQRSFADAREGGFDNINIDVMWALPGQDIPMALADLEAAVELGPEHISWYQLTLEPNTVFHAQPPAGIPDDEAAWEMQEQGFALLARHGYEQYEVSAFARNGRRCRHNLTYWRFGDYLAAGAGAHGKLSVGQEPVRYQKPANPLGYIHAMRDGQAPPMRPVAASERVFEFVLMTTRLKEGFSERQFEQTTGLPAAELRRALTNPLEKGLLEQREAGYYRPTDLGWRFLNELQAGFLS